MNKTYETKDFYLAVSLRAFGYMIQSLKRIDAKSVMFIFDNHDGKIGDAIKAYWDRKLLVDGRSFVDSVAELKTRMYDKNL